MKNKYILFTVMFFIFGALYAQSLSGIKICIDPGHGGFTSNDRHMPEVGFWESQSNMEKALYLEALLKEHGATVYLTRHANNSEADDISLSARSEIANTNNVDYFHSIHSNATGSSVRRNSVLILFRGYDNSPVYPASKEFGLHCFKKLTETNKIIWTYSWDNVRGDWSFYPDWNLSGLGVLRRLTMPGTLSEGSHHDYLPETWRLMNPEYKKHEAWGLLRSFLAFYKKEPLKTGIICGVLRNIFDKVPAEYQPLSGTNDDKKPINGIKVTLQPGNLVYHGDDMNNGYYMFDNLQPGKYKLYFEAINYATDSAEVTVTANKSVHVDKFLAYDPNPNNPTIVSYSPQNGAKAVSNFEEIAIDFDIMMNTALTEGAFTISPEVTGTFKWENYQRRMVFVPSVQCTPGEEYTVSISTEAETYFNKKLENPLTFKYTTRDEMKLLSQYPIDGDEDISTTVSIHVAFDAPVKASTLGKNFSFVKKDGSSVSIKVDLTAYAKGKVIFEPKNPLENDTEYTVTFKSGVGDVEGLTYGKDIVINFRTEKGGINNGVLVNDFEDISLWKNPVTDPMSKGLIADATSLMIDDSRKYNGNASAKLSYSFNQDDAYCMMKSTAPAEVGTGVSSQFGIRIYGELSGNVLEYWFTNSQNQDVVVTVDTLNWTGWKFKSINLTEADNSGKAKFLGIGIKKAANGLTFGVVNFDEAKCDFVTSVQNEDKAIPSSYALAQNYPNPFNPTTVISYQLPKAGKVSLKVYDVLGKEVATLVNDVKQSGSYQINFDASNLASGVYIYTIRANDYISSKKMLLIK